MPLDIAREAAALEREARDTPLLVSQPKPFSTRGCGGRSGDEERPRQAFALGGRSAAAALRYVAP